MLALELTLRFSMYCLLCLLLYSDLPVVMLRTLSPMLIHALRHSVLLRQVPLHWPLLSTHSLGLVRLRTRAPKQRYIHLP